MGKKTQHQEIMDQLKIIEIELKAQSFFAWYVLGIAMMITGASIVFSGFHVEGLIFIFLGIAIWGSASYLTRKLRKKSK